MRSAYERGFEVAVGSSGTVNAIAADCLAQGVIILTAGTYSNVIRLLPPINIEDDLLEDGLAVLASAIGAATA